MKIAYYMPFKPMNHPNPSGDMVTGTEIFDHLKERGHQIDLVSRLRCRWIYYRPLTLLRLLSEQARITRSLSSPKNKADLWLSYHSYYKAPDLLGLLCSRRLSTPYVIFQGIYSTKRRKQLKTLPGFLLNRQVLRAASHIFTNKKRDYKNLRRLLPEERISYIAPGIKPQQFKFSAVDRNELRQKYQRNKETIIMSAAMMRPGVKTKGLKRTIRSCGELLQKGLNIRLLIAGDGGGRLELEQEASIQLAGRVDFLGKIPRQELYKYYSCADIFAFPGIEESLGMVYLEAQSCGLPVVAYSDWGGSEAAIHGKTGLLSPASEPDRFTESIHDLITDPQLRKTLGGNGAEHVRTSHELTSDYQHLDTMLHRIISAQCQ